MSRVRSSGILLYRYAPDASIEVWIAHMGGPFWAKKDNRAWSIPKGEHHDGEDSFAVARREFAEEIGAEAPDVAYTHLGDFPQASGKVVSAFAAESDFSVDQVRSNTFTLEWPPRSGVIRDFPEIDDAGWFALETARSKLVKGQVAILDALQSRLREGRPV